MIGPAAGGNAMVTSEKTDATLAPVQQTDRIEALDILRGIAVLGILLMNIVGFGLPWAYDNPTVAGGMDPPNYWAWVVPTVFFEGTMRGIFSLLFGASIVLLTDRMEQSGAGLKTADVYFRRMLWMMFFGVIHWALLLWIGEILFAYSIGGLLLFAFRKMAPRLMLEIAAALLFTSVGSSIVSHQSLIDASAAAEVAESAKATGLKLSKEQHEAIKGWNKQVSAFSPKADDLMPIMDIHEGSYINAVVEQFPMSYEFQWTHLPWWLFFDMISFMLIGMAFLKTGVLSGGKSARFYAMMMLGGYAVGLPLNYWELQIFQHSGFSLLGVSQAGISYEISRLAMVIGHLGLFLSIIRGRWLKPAQRALAATGQMALSNYIGQTLMCTALFFGFGFGMFNQLERHELFYVVAAIWALELAWSSIWLKHFRFGPLEWLWRSLTYWQRQPMRR
jgi:uncharacterized protein